MKYLSTRDSLVSIDSAKAIVQGLSSDGGLFIPNNFPLLSLEILKNKQYYSIVAEILSLFLTDFSKDFLALAAKKAYSKENFQGKEGKIRRISENLCILELWHGPTAAFKDYALQLLPELLCEAKRIIGDRSKTLILVATSGDTGSAALNGFCDCPGTKLIVFYPNNATSDIQRRQMTTAPGDNVSVCGIRGNFDEAQRAVKTIFTDDCLTLQAAQNNICLSSANSMNFGRLVPQICYYFSSYVEMLNEGAVTPNETIDFVVPTGNFGDILAGFYAKMMGLPIGKLICASNKNNILTDFFNTGVYDINRPFYKTNSPSMDILISSNLERLLYHLCGDTDYICRLMRDLKDIGRFEVSAPIKEKLNEHFFAGYASEETASAAMQQADKKYRYLCDTHTGVALAVADIYRGICGPHRQIIILSTATPYKFPADVLYSLGLSERFDELSSTTMLREAFPDFPIPYCIEILDTKEIRHHSLIDIDKAPDFVKKFIAQK